MADEDALSSATPIGGAVVTIGTDLTPLHAGVEEVKQVAADVDQMTATVKITADAASVTEAIASLPRASGGKGVSLTVTVDEVAADGQVRRMMDRLQAEVASTPLVVQIRTASGNFTLDATAAGGLARLPAWTVDAPVPGPAVSPTPPILVATPSPTPSATRPPTPPTPDPYRPLPDLSHLLTGERLAEHQARVAANPEAYGPPVTVTDAASPSPAGARGRPGDQMPSWATPPGEVAAGPATPVTSPVANRVADEIRATVQPPTPTSSASVNQGGVSELVAQIDRLVTALASNTAAMQGGGGRLELTSPSEQTSSSPTVARPATGGRAGGVGDGQATRPAPNPRPSQADDADSAPSEDQSSSGGGRGGVLNFRSLARRVTGGVLAAEGIRLVSSALQTSEAMSLAGNDSRVQYAAQQQRSQTITSIPFIGQLAGLAAESWSGQGVRSAATMAAADAQDRYGDAMLNARHFERDQEAQHRIVQASTPYEAERLAAQNAARQRGIEVDQQARAQSTALNTAAEAEAVAEATRRAPNPVWTLSHPTEFQSMVTEERNRIVAPRANQIAAEAQQLHLIADQDANRQQIIISQGEANDAATARVAVETSRAAGQSATAVAVRDPIQSFQVERDAERRQQLQDLQNQIASAAINNPEAWSQLRQLRTATFGTFDPNAGTYVGGSFDTTTAAGLQEQRLQSTVRTEDYQARGTAAEQFAGGQRERAGLTVRNRQLEREAELLPSADATSPEAQQVRAAGLKAINDQLTGEESGLTGRHGGGVGAGVSFGEAGVRLLAARARAGEVKAETADIEATRHKVNGEPAATADGSATPKSAAATAPTSAPPQGQTAVTGQAAPSAAPGTVGTLTIAHADVINVGGAVVAGQGGRAGGAGTGQAAPGGGTPSPTGTPAGTPTPAPTKGVGSVAVFPFDPTGPVAGVEGFGRDARASLKAAVTASGGAVVTPDVKGGDDPVAVAKGAGAATAVTGTYKTVGPNVEATARLVDTATGKQLGTASGTAPIADAAKLQAALGEQVQRLVPTSPGVVGQAATATKTPDDRPTTAPTSPTSSPPASNAGRSAAAAGRSSAHHVAPGRPVADPKRTAERAAADASAQAYREYRAAASAAARTRSGDPAYRSRQAAAKTAREHWEQSRQQHRDVHAPHNGHAAPRYGLVAQTEMSDARPNADGTVSVHSASAGIQATLTADQQERLNAARRDRYGRTSPRERDHRARAETHGPVQTPSMQRPKPSYGTAIAAAELTDQSRNRDGTVTVRSRAVGITARLTPDQAANVRREAELRVAPPRAAVVPGPRAVVDGRQVAMPDVRAVMPPSPESRPVVGGTDASSVLQAIARSTAKTADSIAAAITGRAGTSGIVRGSAGY